MSDPDAPPPGPSPPGPSPKRRTVGGLMMAAGLLIAGLCGLCTGYFEIMFLGDDSGTLGDGAAVIPVMIGGLPILLGVGLFLWGRRLARTAPRPGRPR